MERKKYLLVVNYYYPYISGLSEVVRLLAEGLAKAGQDVTVVCSNHANLPEREVLNGVKVLRTPVWLRISKGTISPAFITQTLRLAKDADIVNLHAPMLESGLISALVDKKKLVVTYHCDIDLKPGLVNNFIKSVMLMMNNWALKNARKIMVTSVDYGSHSLLASRYTGKLVEVHTPIKDYSRVPANRPAGKHVIGFCGRLVMEKGIDVLLKAYQILRSKRSDLCLWIGGDYQNVAGGSIYPELEAFVRENNLQDVYFLGKIPEEKMAEFYSSLDVFALPSTNPLEAFGMVQVEAMFCGTPVTASDLYGVRTIIGNTGMGLVHKKGNPEDLARCLEEIIDHPETYIRPKAEIAGLYSTEQFLHDYEVCCNEICMSNT